MREQRVPFLVVAIHWPEVLVVLVVDEGVERTVERVEYDVGILVVLSEEDFTGKGDDLAAFARAS